MSAAVRTLIVRDCEPVYWGDGFVLYEVTATDPDGRSITVPLRSFKELPAGAGEFEVTRYERRGELSFTLKPRRKPAHPSPPLFDAETLGRPA